MQIFSVTVGVCFTDMYGMSALHSALLSTFVPMLINEPLHIVYWFNLLSQSACALGPVAVWPPRSN